MPGSETAVTRLIFVSLVFHPDSSASSILFTDLFRRLSGDGARIEVLCGFPSKDRIEDVSRLPRRESVDGISVRRCGLRIEGKRNGPFRAMTYLTFLLHVGWILLWRPSDTRVGGGTDPPFTPVALWMLSRLRRFRYDCILLDLYPDGLVSLGTVREDSIVVRLWRALNRRAFRAARRVIVIGRDMRELLMDRYSVDPESIRYVPHWGAAEIDAHPLPRDAGLLCHLGLTNRFVVQYSGNMGLWHDLDTLVRAADLLRDDPHIHFLLVGKGRRRADAERLARACDLKNVTWLDFMPRERLAETLASCDCAVVSLRAGLQGIAVPSKLYGILATGRAVIAQVPANSEVACTVREHDCGVVVAPGDPDALAAAIRDLSIDPTTTRAMGVRGRHAYETNYTLDTAASRFNAIWHVERIPDHIQA